MFNQGDVIVSNRREHSFRKMHVVTCDQYKVTGTVFHLSGRVEVGTWDPAHCELTKEPIALVGVNVYPNVGEFVKCDHRIGLVTDRDGLNFKVIYVGCVETPIVIQQIQQVLTTTEVINELGSKH